MKKIIIWGTGENAYKFYYKARQEYDIIYFLDNYPKIDMLHGKKVYKPSKENTGRGILIVIASVYYCEIAEQLKCYGLEELKDFIPYQALGKKIVMCYGNCYFGLIKEYLMTSAEFMQTHYFYPLPPIQSIEKECIDDDLLKNCDIFIHQDVQKENFFGEKFSMEYIIPRLGRDTVRICIPNLVGLGTMFFPQISGNKHNRIINQNDGLFPYGDENIEKLWQAGNHDIEEITKALESDVYSREYVLEQFELYINKIREREKNWDIKKLDYILQTYKKEKVFYEHVHACNNVMKKISMGIMHFLGLDSGQIQDIQKDFSVFEMPIYPCVKKYLGLEYTNEKLRGNGRRLVSGDMNMAEFVAEYCYWCFGQ